MSIGKMGNRRKLVGRHSATVPAILVVTTNRWALAPRLACGFLELSCRVAAVCPKPGHPMRKVRGLNRSYRYDGRNPLRSLRTAIEDFNPDIIVPVCDRSVRHLHELYASCSCETELDHLIKRLIERSLGPSTSYSVVASRYDLLMLARDEGIRVPETVRIDSAKDLQDWKCPPPWMLKASGTNCGNGVRRAETFDQVELVLRELTRTMKGFRLIKQLLFYRDRDWTISASRAARPEIIAQAMVQGRPANCTVVCWEGQVLAGIAVEVVQAVRPLEPAILVQVVEGSAMLEAATCLARRLQLSGFFGLDFMIEEGTGEVFLIEMNPRCSPPCWLNLGEGKDLLAAIWSRLTDQGMPQRPAMTDNSRIAYFPQAMQNRSAQAHAFELDAAYQDFPVDEPDLVYELLHPRSEMSPAGRLFYHFRRGSSEKQLPAPCVFKVPQFEESNKREPESTHAGRSC